MSRSALLRCHDCVGIAARWLAFAGTFFLGLSLMPQLALATEPATSSSTAASAVPGVRAPDASPGTDGATGANADQTLLLDVDVNGHSIGMIGEFTLHRGKLMARPD